LMIDTIIHGNCLEVMRRIPDKSIDMILCDLPYGQTARNTWDLVIPLDLLWNCYSFIIKNNTAIVLFGNGMFTADLMLSNRKIWRYNWIWDKGTTTGFLNAYKMPLREHEDILVFYDHLPVYNPQKTQGSKSHSKGKKQRTDVGGTTYNKAAIIDNSETLGNQKFPTSILHFKKIHPSKSLHPNQKPVDLCEYLIKTYTNPGDLVLDSCVGSGTTAIAAINTGRHYIGIEKELKYVETARKCIDDLNKSLILKNNAKE
jgi:site-specific DNA-methyltransferase (adenine-specific)